MVRSLNKSWIVWYAISIHIFWGVLLLVDSRVAWVTAIHDLGELLSGNLGAALVLLTVSVASIAGIFLSRVNQLLSLVLMLPQQGLMVIAAVSAINAVVTSSFADGVIRPRLFIAADQFPAVLAMIMHTLAMWDHYAGYAFRRKSK